MLEAKRTIPRVATASLVLGGGCGVSTVATPSSTAFEFCDSLFYCGYQYSVMGGYYYSYYDFASFAHCRNDMTLQYRAERDDFDYFVSRRCGDAFLNYVECFWLYYGDFCDENDAAYFCADLRYDFDFWCY